MNAHAEPSWKHRFLQVWPYATTATSVLFVGCALTGWFIAWQSGAKEGFSYLLAAVDPAAAALFMLLVCAIKPDVFVGKRFRSPHVVTLPTLFLVLVFGIKELGKDSVGSLQRYEGADRFDLIWLDPRVILQAWLVLVLIFVAIRAQFGETDEQTT